jgi:hypothetical protein
MFMNVVRQVTSCGRFCLAKSACELIISEQIQPFVTDNVSLSYQKSITNIFCQQIAIYLHKSLADNTIAIRKIGPLNID